MAVPDAVEPRSPSGQHTSPERLAAWRAVTASERGAAHIANGVPSQDAVGVEQLTDGLVAAVADGHGHWRHFRSARGSQAAIDIGCRTSRELADRLTAGVTEVAEQITDELTEFLVPTLVRRWRGAVLADLAENPFSAEEIDRQLPDDDPTVAYGSTLLLAITWRHWLVLAQIGDGDIVGVQPDGQELLAVPSDPQLDGRYTTSLCGQDAESDVRCAVVDTRQVPLSAVLLATDGYGNAQAADPWTGRFSRDIAGLLSQRGATWLAEQLPNWVARCASSDGSADDTTVALLLAPGVPATGAADGAAAPIGYEPTIPIPLASEAPTVPAPLPRQDAT